MESSRWVERGRLWRISGVTEAQVGHRTGEEGNIASGLKARAAAGAKGDSEKIMRVNGTEEVEAADVDAFMRASSAGGAIPERAGG